MTPTRKQLPLVAIGLILLGTTESPGFDWFGIFGPSSEYSDAPIEEIDARVSTILHTKDIWLDEGETAAEALRTNLPGDVEMAGQILAETTARFEGCALVIRIQHPGECGSITLEWSTEARTDLRLIQTEPRRVWITQLPPSQAQSEPMGMLFYHRTQEAIDGLGQPLPSDDILQQTGARTQSCDGTITLHPPSDSLAEVFFVRPDHVDEFIDLVHARKKRFCG